MDLSSSAGGELGDSPVSQAAVRDHLKLSKSSASYRVRRLLRLGYLANLADKGEPMQLVPGTPLPDKPAPLPTPCDLAAHLIAMGRDELVQPFINPVTGEAHNCRIHLGLETSFFFADCQECVEPQVDSVADPLSEDQRFIANEPLNPNDTKGSRVQTAMNPSPSVADAVAGSDLGFKVTSEDDDIFSCSCPDPTDPPMPGDEQPTCACCGQSVFWCSTCGGCRLCRLSKDNEVWEVAPEDEDEPEKWDKTGWKLVEENEAGDKVVPEGSEVHIHLQTGETYYRLMELP